MLLLLAMIVMLHCLWCYLQASSPSKSTPKTITEFGSSTDATKKLVDVKTAAGE